MIGTGDSNHRFGLIDRAEQRSPHSYIVERGMQMVKAHHANGCGILGNNRDIALMSDARGKVARRCFPPVDFASAQGGHRRKRIQGQPLDPIECAIFGPEVKPTGAPVRG